MTKSPFRNISASKLLFGDGESSEDEDFNRKKKPKSLEQSLTSTLECLNEDAEFWRNNVINKKRNSDQAVSFYLITSC